MQAKGEGVYNSEKLQTSYLHDPQYCASVYNCTEPTKCWMEDIKSHGYLKNIDSVMAVSIMPGCKLSGESRLNGCHPWLLLLKNQIFRLTFSVHTWF